MSFRNRLNPEQIRAVADFIQENFVKKQRFNTAYHIGENGWVHHERYRAAFPFVLGNLPVYGNEDILTDEQKEGRRLFLSSCITCHEPHSGEALIFESRPVSSPRSGYSHRLTGALLRSEDMDSVSSASPYARHDQKPSLSDLSAQEQEGEALFQNNCAFCHAADGTGKGWIGQFLQPHARDLTTPALHRRLDAEGLRQTILNGVQGTTMPAWRDVLSTQQIDAVVAYVLKAFYDPHRPDISKEGPAHE